MSTNSNRFDALERLDRELKADKALYEQNRRFSLDVGTAVTLYNLYTSLEELYEPSDSTNEAAVRAYYTEAMSLVEICAVYFKETRTMSESDVTYYRFGQSAIVKKHFDLLRGELSIASKEQKNTEK